MRNSKIFKYLGIAVAVSAVVYGIFEVPIPALSQVITGSSSSSSTLSSIIKNIWMLNSSGDVYNTNPGKVGIGTKNPAAQLHVDGGFSLKTNHRKPPCNGETRGTFWYESSNLGIL